MEKYIPDKTYDILVKYRNTHTAINLLNENVNMHYLDEFHNQFIIVPMDKATKTFCLQVLNYLQFLRKKSYHLALLLIHIEL